MDDYQKWAARERRWRIVYAVGAWFLVIVGAALFALMLYGGLLYWLIVAR